MFTDTAFTEVIASASLALQADGNYVFAYTTNETVAGYLSVYVDTVSGTWKQGATTSALTFTDVTDPKSAVSGTWSGNTVTLLDAESNVTWLFTRK